ncbi:MAG TPA: hypothetical protein VJ801_12170, partial [Polyangia bacterium]|nr:hypothetical protein [Polyangia bacterium]
TCAPPAPITAVASIRIVPDADAQLRPLRQRLHAIRRVFLLTMNATSSLTETENRVRDLLSRLCVRSGVMPFGATPHYALKHLWKRDAQPYRFQRETWQCPAVDGPMGEASDR